MAKLRVAPEMIVESLFKSSAPGVAIVGASFDGQCVVLEIEGAQVPDSEFVAAEFRVERFDVSFKARM